MLIMPKSLWMDTPFFLEELEMLLNMYSILTHAVVKIKPTRYKAVLFCFINANERLSTSGITSYSMFYDCM